MMKKNYCKKCEKEISWQGKSGLCKSCVKKGIRFTKNHKKKISISKIGELNPNYKGNKARYKQKNYCIDCNKEIHRTSKRCNSCHNRQMILKRFKNPENHPNWKGGKSFEKYGLEFDSHLKEQVRFRDKYKCKNCGCSQLENNRKLDIHHIDYNKKNNKLNNLVALCKTCHRKTNFNREYWLEHYSDIITGQTRRKLLANLKTEIIKRNSETYDGPDLYPKVTR